MTARAPLVLIALALVAPGAVAQDHAHGDDLRLLLLHDGPDDGHALVGSVTGFGFALVDKAGVPVEHHDFAYWVQQGDVRLLETESSHDYDGVANFNVRFTRAGPYVVHAEARSGGETVAVGHFEGVAVAASKPLDVKLEVDWPTMPTAAVVAPFEVRVADAVTGALVHHTDARIELRRVVDHLLVLDTHLHTHRDPMRFEFAFPTPGAYEARVTAWNAFPTKTGAEFDAVVLRETLQIGLAPPAPRSPAPTQVTTAAEDHQPHGLKLHVTTDPTPLAGVPVIGPFTHMRLSGLATDEDGIAALAHTNHVATVTGPAGVVFASESLHEYDGRFELGLAGLAPGDYVFDLTAERGDDSAAGQATFTVVPPVVPITAGPYVVTLAGIDKARANEAVPLVFAAKSADGRALTHTELLVTVLPDDGGPFLADSKLHTHASGEFTMAVAFPTPGSWRVLVDPTPLEPRPSLAVSAAGPGQPIQFTVNVQDGIELPDLDAQTGADVAPAFTIPGFGVFAVAAALAVAVGLARRRV